MELVLASLIYPSTLWVGVTIADKYFPATSRKRNAVGSFSAVMLALIVHFSVGATVIPLQ